jgi:large subunit ribosomal protein L4
MATVKLTQPSGRASGSVELDDALFGVEPNGPVMHQVVTAQLAARRAGTQSTKTRAEVRGGGAKPWRQKGTGRSRQGSIRSPQWRGGGVALGPKPRSYRQRTPKKMIRLALASALSDRFADDRVKVLKGWGIDEPSTRAAREVLAKLDLDGRVLVVLTRDDEAVWKSLRNLPEVHVLTTGELNAYDVLVSDWVVFTEDSLPAGRSERATGDAKASAGPSGQRRGIARAGGPEAEPQAEAEEQPEADK